MQHGVQSDARCVVQWEPSGIGCYKANVDVAYDSGRSITTLSVVVRDHIGDVAFCATSSISHVVSALHAKLLALRFGVEQVVEARINEVHFESDSLIAIGDLKKGQFNL